MVPVGPLRRVVALPEDIVFPDAEDSVWSYDEKARAYYRHGDEDGDALHMRFSFVVNQALYLALVREDAGPLRGALEALPEIPEVVGRPERRLLERRPVRSLRPRRRRGGVLLRPTCSRASTGGSRTRRRSSSSSSRTGTAGCGYGREGEG